MGPFQLCSIITTFPGSLFSDPWPVSLCDCDGWELCYQYQVIYLVSYTSREMIASLLSFGFLRILFKSDGFVCEVEALHWWYLWVHAEYICKSKAKVWSWSWPWSEAHQVQSERQDRPTSDGRWEWEGPCLAFFKVPTYTISVRGKI